MSEALTPWIALEALHIIRDKHIIGRNPKVAQICRPPDKDNRMVVSDSEHTADLFLTKEAMASFQLSSGGIQLRTHQLIKIERWRFDTSTMCLSESNNQPSGRPKKSSIGLLVLRATEIVLLAAEESAAYRSPRPLMDDRRIRDSLKTLNHKELLDRLVKYQRLSFMMDAEGMEVRGLFMVSDKDNLISLKNFSWDDFSSLEPPQGEGDAAPSPLVAAPAAQQPFSAAPRPPPPPFCPRGSACRAHGCPLHHDAAAAAAHGGAPPQTQDAFLTQENSGEAFALTQGFDDGDDLEVRTDDELGGGPAPGGDGRAAPPPDGEAAGPGGAPPGAGGRGAPGRRAGGGGGAEEGGVGDGRGGGEAGGEHRAAAGDDEGARAEPRDEEENERASGMVPEQDDAHDSPGQTQVQDDEFTQTQVQDDCEHLKECIEQTQVEDGETDLMPPPKAKKVYATKQKHGVVLASNLSEEKSQPLPKNTSAHRSTHENDNSVAKAAIAPGKGKGKQPATSSAPDEDEAGGSQASEEDEEESQALLTEEQGPQPRTGGGASAAPAEPPRLRWKEGRRKMHEDKAQHQHGGGSGDRPRALHQSSRDLRKKKRRRREEQRRGRKEAGREEERDPDVSSLLVRREGAEKGNWQRGAAADPVVAASLEWFLGSGRGQGVKGQGVRAGGAKKGEKGPQRRRVDFGQHPTTTSQRRRINDRRDKEEEAGDDSETVAV